VAKVSGIPTSFTIDDAAGSPVTFSNEVGTVSINLSRAQQDVSGLDVDGTERIQLRGDYTVSFTGFWNPEVVIPVFGDLAGARDLIIAYPGATLTGVVVISSFTPAVAQDGSLGWTAEGAQSAGELGEFELAP
jgi:hypothetical protein